MSAVRPSSFALACSAASCCRCCLCLVFHRFQHLNITERACRVPANASASRCPFSPCLIVSHHQRSARRCLRASAQAIAVFSYQACKPRPRQQRSVRRIAVDCAKPSKHINRRRRVKARPVRSRREWRVRRLPWNGLLREAWSPGALSSESSEIGGTCTLVPAVHCAPCPPSKSFLFPHSVAGFLVAAVSPASFAGGVWEGCRDPVAWPVPSTAASATVKGTSVRLNPGTMEGL